MLPIAYAADGLLFLPVAFTHDIRIAILFSALASACLLFEIAQIVSWRMRITPNDLIGRVFGAVRLVALIGTVPGSLLGGAIADRYGARQATIVAAIGYLGIAILVGAMPQIRREKR
jgi:predicted MFS family arabinose efflux permease